MHGLMWIARRCNFVIGVRAANLRTAFLAELNPHRKKLEDSRTLLQSRVDAAKAPGCILHCFF